MRRSATSLATPSRTVYSRRKPGALVKLGGPTTASIVNIGTITGPWLGWSELTLDGSSAAITEWNGFNWVPIETSLREIASGGTVDVLGGRNYVTANSLTIDDTGTVTVGVGMLNLQAGTVSVAGGININSGIVQGYGTIASGIANNGRLIAL